MDISFQFKRDLGISHQMLVSFPPNFILKLIKQGTLKKEIMKNKFEGIIADLLDLDPS